MDPKSVVSKQQESTCGPVSLTYYQTILESIGISVQEKKINTDFQDGSHGGHLGFPIRTILVTFDLEVTSILPTKFHVNRSFGSGEKFTIDSQHGGYADHRRVPSLTVLDSRYFLSSLE